MTVTFDHSAQETDQIVSFFFKPESALRYTAGQFIELSISHPKPDKRGTRRWFSLSSPPTDELLSITTRLTDQHGSTYKKALRKLQPGDQLEMSEPMGDFVLPKLVQTPLVFVAAGIGITPFHSILGWLTDTSEQRPISLLYGVHTEEDIIFLDTFQKAGQHATILVSEPSAAWGGERGHLTAELITGLESITADSLIYISGPEPLVENLEKDLKKSGIKQHQLVLDCFPNYTEV